jgi:hypothetical protein
MAKAPPTAPFPYVRCECDSGDPPHQLPAGCPPPIEGVTVFAQAFNFLSHHHQDYAGTLRYST